MSRTHNNITRVILSALLKADSLVLDEIHKLFKESEHKAVYDALYRLKYQGYIDINKSGGKHVAVITTDGRVLARLQNPERDGVWKLIVFDIPESQRRVRDHIRTKIRGLGFKKWQTSIWVSPYELDQEIEAELLLLAEKYFIRLIKTTDINYMQDLEKLFGE